MLNTMGSGNSYDIPETNTNISNEDTSEKQNIVIIAPHADDELAFAATIFNQRHLYNRIYVVFILKPYNLDTIKDSYKKLYGDNIIPEWIGEKYLNGRFNINYNINSTTYFLEVALKDQQLNLVPQPVLSNLIKYYIDECNVDTIYIPAECSSNLDHQVVSKAAKIACRPFKTKTSLNTVIEYITQGTDVLDNFKPNMYTEIDIQTKIKFLNSVYNHTINSEDVGIFNNKDVMALNRYYGMHMGVDYAEPFKIVYKLNYL
jgi:hypothetical protein